MFFCVFVFCHEYALFTGNLSSVML
uniref:Uncharacterized protein n=1 Tax=Rhizophora mucronata TaxID=61149 RepID=A0A2P2IY04_RHIMU